METGRQCRRRLLDTRKLPREAMMYAQVMVGETGTLIIGLVALFAGMRVRKSFPVLRRLDVPYAVIGAVAVAVIVLLIHLILKIDIVFADRLRDFLLLVFFTTIGLSAKLSALRPIMSEYGYMHRRVQVEVTWFIPPLEMAYGATLGLASPELIDDMLMMTPRVPRSIIRRRM